MNAKPILKIVSCLMLLFIMGSICGYAVSGRVQSSRPAWTRSQQWAEQWLEARMAQDFARLNVTPEQEAALRPIYTDLLSDFNAIQSESQQQIAEAFKRHGTAMWKQLTPEQRELNRQHNQERFNRKANSNS